MAMIDDRHVEWRVVARLRELLEELPPTTHDVTLTYSLFSTILCWVCQRIRDREHDAATSVWAAFERELAFDQPWGLSDIDRRAVTEGDLHISTLPVSVLLVGLRNAVAHGDDRKVRPHHIGDVGRPDRRLVGFDLDAGFYRPGVQRTKHDPPEWGQWRLSVTAIDMRRIGLAVADRFCGQMDRDSREDAEQHVLVA
jgi:hypothetical protein